MAGSLLVFFSAALISSCSSRKIAVLAFFLRPNHGTGMSYQGPGWQSTNISAANQTNLATLRRPPAMLIQVVAVLALLQLQLHPVSPLLALLVDALRYRLDAV